MFKGHVTISTGGGDKRITAVNFVEASVVIETRKGAAGLVELRYAGTAYIFIAGE